MIEPKKDPRAEQPQWSEAQHRAFRTVRHIITSDTRAAPPIIVPADLFALVTAALASMWVYVPDLPPAPGSVLVGGWQQQDCRKQDKALKVLHVLVQGVPIAPDRQEPSHEQERRTNTGDAQGVAADSKPARGLPGRARRPRRPAGAVDTGARTGASVPPDSGAAAGEPSERP